ncbi:MAG TPA: amidohydrolase family protein [Candidatus Limnocylindrales bacterium]
MTFPVVDAHHHLWDPARASYPWMTADLDPIRRRFGVEDLVPLLDAAGVAGTVLVQTRSSSAESREFLATAAGTPRIAGVVAWTDLTSQGVDDDIAALRDAPGGDRLVGIRHQVHDEDDAAWLLRADVRRGLLAVERAGLVYDLLVRAREMPVALEVVRAMPDLRFVVDHLAKPTIVDGAMSPWSELLEPFGELPNVTCKLSGLVTEADWSSWTIADLEPYVDRALELFGPDRMLFGSDWPVSLVAAPYQTVFDTAQALLAGLSGDERAAVMGGTAVEVYDLRID